VNYSETNYNRITKQDLPCSPEITRKHVQRTFKEFASRPLYSFSPDNSVTADDRLVVASVCKRPELRPLLRNIVFSIDNLHNLPFILLSDRGITIDRRVLKTPVLAAFHLRHALELVTLRSCLPDERSLSMSLAVAMAAFHTALSYLEGMIGQERILVRDNFPAWEQRIAGIFREYTGNEEVETEHSALVTDCLDLLRLEGQEIQDVRTEEIQSAVATTLKRLKALLPLSCPAEHLLMSGGDSRLIVDDETGLNTYGCSPRPRPWAITFSSCTASSISDIAFQEAEWLRQSLLLDAWKGSLIGRCEAELQHIRGSISRVFELEQVPGTEIILTPSGTDSEFYALYFAMGASEHRICNILISSTEIGSGTVYAAGGRHYDTLAPHSCDVEAGMSLEGFPCHRVGISTLELRHNNGALLTTDELNSATETLVTKAINKGERVLIHLLDCSKTGIGGPGIDTIRELRRKHPALVTVVVDAAQMRLGRESLRRYLGEGFMVLFTASKFFTGPPFSGALLVPPTVAREVPGLDPLPPGFTSYSTRWDLPHVWQKLATALEPEANLGLLLRWRSAIWEMTAFHSVSSSDKYRTLKTFGKEILRMIQDSPDLNLVMAPPHERGSRGQGVSWDQLPSIFTFLVHHRNEAPVRQPLSYDETCIAYRCLNMDVSHLLPIQASDREYELARKRCHIGQPVRIQQEGGRWVGGLRIAAGARLVSGVEFDDALGETPCERLETEIRTVRIILFKLSVIVKYWTDLSEYDLCKGIKPGAGYYLY